MQYATNRKISRTGICTGCGLCANICPRKCIALEEDELGSVYPKINEEQCCNCYICEKNCPENVPVDVSEPRNAYVVVKKNKNEEQSVYPSSSGGVANLIYQHTLKNSGVCVGALWNNRLEVELHSTENKETLEYFKNSKYVYSKLQYLFDELEGDVLSRQVSIVALPCQIAALKKKLGNRDNILYVDLVCHGVANSSYFQEYVDTLGIDRKNVDNVIFRGGGV